MAPALPRCLLALAALTWPGPAEARLSSDGLAARAPKVLAAAQLPPNGDYSYGDPSKHVHHRKAKKSEAARKKAGLVEGEGEGEVEKEHEHEAQGDRASLLAAFMVMSSVAIASAIFAMARTKNTHVAAMTWQTLDLVISIFVAVLWFQAIFDFIDEIKHNDNHETLLAIVAALVTLFLALALSWGIRRHETTLAIFCGCGAHYVSFTSMGAASVVQDHHFDDSKFETLTSIIVLVVFVAVLGVVLFFVKRAMGLRPGEESEDESANGWMERFDDVENDFAAMALALAWTAFVRYLIVGKFPDDESVEPGEEKDHTAIERATMLTYGLVMVTLTVLVTRTLDIYAGSRKYWKDRFMMFAKSTMTFACAWAFLLWGQMEVYEGPHLGAPIFARLLFAVLATAAAILIVLLFALARSHSSRPAVIVGQEVFVTAVSLVVGWAWEETFDQCIDDIVEEEHLEKHKHIVKMGLAFMCALIVLPVYAIYLKPILFAYEAKAKAAEERS